MTPENQPVEIVSLLPRERASLIPILEESFEGLYLWHSKRTLRSIEVVRAARMGGEYAGLAMLKTISDRVGYVYYIAVSKRFRRKGVGRLLLEDALSGFFRSGVEEVYASVEEDNVESSALFGSKGFERVERSALSQRYGHVRAFVMSREMMLVPGEILLRKRLESTSG